jgi:hypothetical protein
MKHDDNVTIKNENNKPYERRLNDQGDNYKFLMSKPTEEH